MITMTNDGNNAKNLKIEDQESWLHTTCLLVQSFILHLHVRISRYNLFHDVLSFLLGLLK